MANDRPNPDALLAEVQQQESKRQRGKLKVFFGMSAGVGKTYAMLEEARKRAAEGADVVVGYAEPHIRPDTEALMLGMELLPYRIVEHRGAKLKEFDLDAALARRPTIVCVDELAHTNAPSMRHPKRWQDVAELLDAGIGVYTTLNVQHLEGFNDIVERITGVRVQETLPDAVLEQADEVELVDIAPEELLERFGEGKIYRPEQAERAARHFFTKGNLIALRELALRKTAERVDAQMLDYRRDERVHRIIPASERVLVCVSPSPLSSRLVRSARRLAAGMRAKLIAAYIETPAAANLSDQARQRVERNLRLAEELGAKTVILRGPNVADELLAYAGTHNVTKIVVGKPIRSKWRDFMFGSIVDDLIRRSGDIDVYVIRGEGDPAEKSEPREGRARPGLDWRGCGAALALVVLTTAMGWPLHHQFGVANENILMLYLLGVLWIATRHSRLAAALASIFSVAAFDLTFVPPFYSFAVTDRQYMVTFCVMLLTALLISALAHRVRAQTEAARQRERRTAAVLSLAGELAVAPAVAQVLQATVRHVVDVLGGRAAVMLPQGGHRLEVRADSASPGGLRLDDRELGVAQWAFEHSTEAGRGTATLPAAAGQYLPLAGPRGTVGVLVIYPAQERPDWAPEQRQLVQSFCSQAALAIERATLVEEARSAWERAEAEIIRNTLLSGVSHDLRTPLAAITGSVSTLIEAGEKLSDSSRQDMLDSIHIQALRMERLINNLLEMTRLESGSLQLNRSWQHLQEIVGSVLRHEEQRRRNGTRIITSIPSDLPLIYIDEVAMEHVLANLIDNAIQVSPEGSPIEISAEAHGAEQIMLTVADRGPGLPQGSEKRIFDKFFRAPVSPGAGNQGAGLGLAICRAIVEAHEGRITASNRAGGGAEFNIVLPRAAADAPSLPAALGAAHG